VTLVQLLSLHHWAIWLQDDEVDRLERSSQPGGWRGLNRDEVMQSMYGRVDPRPTGRCLVRSGLPTETFRHWNAFDKGYLSLFIQQQIAV